MWLPLLIIGAAVAEVGPTEIKAEPAEVAEPVKVQEQTEEAAPEAAPATGEEVGKGLAGQLAASGSSGRFWHVRGDSWFRMLAISPEVAAPTRWMVYRLRADVDIYPQTRAFAWWGVQQKFVAEPNESGFRSLRNYRSHGCGVPGTLSWQNEEG